MADGMAKQEASRNGVQNMADRLRHPHEVIFRICALVLVFGKSQKDLKLDHDSFRLDEGEAF